jgi:transposase, IS605 orfB family
MLKNNPLAKHISDAGWAMFINMLTYKAELKGKNILQVDTFFPSSKLCHKCNYKNDTLKLTDREWQCPNCKSNLDRDLNAALNIKNKALLGHRVKIKDSCLNKNLKSNLEDSLEAVTLEALIPFRLGVVHF